MSEAKIHYPKKGSKVQLPLAAYGTFKGVKYLFGILQNQDTGQVILGKTLREKDSYWSILFGLEVPGGTYTFYLLGFPGLLLGVVPDLQCIPVEHFSVGISQPTPGQQNLTACFTAAGYASPGGMPSGIVTRVSDGKVYVGTNPTQNGQSWTLDFNVDATPTSTSLFNLHVDVSNSSGSKDDNGLGIPNPC